MGNRRNARELAVKTLFHLEFNTDDPDEACELISQNFDPRRTNSKFSKELVAGVCENMEDLNRLISQTSRHWRLERMPRVDRCILRLAVFEFLFREDIPPRVTIDEAVDIGKRFGSENSGSFINGVLDSIYTALMHQGHFKENHK